MDIKYTYTFGEYSLGFQLALMRCNVNWTTGVPTAYWTRKSNFSFCFYHQMTPSDLIQLRVISGIGIV